MFKKEQKPCVSLIIGNMLFPASGLRRGNGKNKILLNPSSGIL